MTPSNHPWYREALDAVAALSRRQRFLTSDDIWPIVSEPVHPNMMGRLFEIAHKQGLIRRTYRSIRSRRPSRGGSTIQVWESAHLAGRDGLEEWIQQQEADAAHPNQGRML